MNSADITLVNLNMLFIRYGEQVERERHVPLGPLYLTHALQDAGLRVDFRDYQLCPSDDPFDMAAFLEFLKDPAPVIGLSCMANLLPFTIQAMKALRERYPDRKLVLGGVGAKSVEDQILTRFPWIEVICRGEGERTGPELVRSLLDGSDLAPVAGISYRANGAIRHNPDRERIHDLDAIPFVRSIRNDSMRRTAMNVIAKAIKNHAIRFPVTGISRTAMTAEVS